MKERRNFFLVGLAILVALAAVIGGALFLSQADFGRKGELEVARFRSIGGLQAGGAVMHRGVRVGTVQAIRLADEAWVEDADEVNAEERTTHDRCGELAGFGNGDVDATGRVDERDRVLW